MPQSRVEILPAQAGDIPAILSLERLSFKDPYSETLFQIELGLEMAHVYVAKEAGRVVGYMDYWRVGEEIHLIKIAVRPEQRRQGIGQALLERLLAETGRGKEITLDVRLSNQGAISFYEKNQFERVLVRPHYYQDGDEAALVMRRVISATVLQTGLGARDTTERPTQS